MDIRIQPVPVNAAFTCSKEASSLLILIANFGSAYSDYDVNALYLGAVGWRREVRNHDLVAGNVLNPSGVLEEEVMMLGCVGIKIRTSGIHYDFAKQSRFYELMKGIVNGSQRNIDRCCDCFFVQIFRSDMPIPILEQQPGESESLPGRPKFRAAQKIESMAVGTKHFHEVYMAIVCEAGNHIGLIKSESRCPLGMCGRRTSLPRPR